MKMAFYGGTGGNHSNAAGSEMTSMQIRHIKEGPAESFFGCFRGSLAMRWHLKGIFHIFQASISLIYNSIWKHRPPWTLLEKCFCQASKCFSLPYTKRRDKGVRQGHDTYWLCHKPPQQRLSRGCNWGWGCGNAPVRLYPRAAAESVASHKMNVEKEGAFHDPARGWKENKTWNNDGN